MDNVYEFWLNKIEQYKKNWFELSVIKDEIIERPEMSIAQKDSLLKIIEDYGRGELGW